MTQPLRQSFSQIRRRTFCFFFVLRLFACKLHIPVTPTPSKNKIAATNFRETSFVDIIAASWETDEVLHAVICRSDWKMLYWLTMIKIEGIRDLKKLRQAIVQFIWLNDTLNFHIGSFCLRKVKSLFIVLLSTSLWNLFETISSNPQSYHPTTWRHLTKSNYATNQTTPSISSNIQKHLPDNPNHLIQQSQTPHSISPRISSSNYIKLFSYSNSEHLIQQLQTFHLTIPPSSSNNPRHLIQLSKGPRQTTPYILSKNLKHLTQRPQTLIQQPQAFHWTNLSVSLKHYKHLITQPQAS